jgi:hypothetical protein
VPAIFRELGVEPEPHATWAVGAAAREKYRERFGQLPPKELRPKTNGGGSHCFATYPESMRAEIEALVRAVAAQAARQGSLGL